MYKLRRVRRGVASAIAGEIFAIISMVNKRNHVRMFTQIKAKLDKNIPTTVPDIVGAGMGGSLDPVVEGNISQLGYLEGNRVPERIAEFYTNMRGIRIDIINLAKGIFDGDLKIKSSIIGQDLKLWKETQKLGEDLYSELRKIADGLKILWLRF